MSTVKPYTHNHPKLGDLTGRLMNDDEVVHFRNIPFATIAARFRPSVLLDHIPEKFDNRPHRDYTEYGNGCPGRPHPSSNLKDEGERSYDELSCLSVTISVSTSRLKKIQSGDKDSSLVPVLVYVHGGGFSEGVGHISAMHQTDRLADFSVKENLEVVIVSIGYRLGAYSGLVSKDLLEEQKENGDTDIFNHGMFDQRKAFQWIANNIAGFGGDASKVTAFGESAGSISIALHLLANEPIFQRCAMQSGNTATFPAAFSFDEMEVEYQNLLKYYKIEGATAKERVDALRKIPQDELWQGYIATGRPNTHPYFGLEGTFFSKAGKQIDLRNHYQLTAERDWVEAIIVGDDFFEGYIFFQGLQQADQMTFVKTAQEVFGNETAKKLLAAYDISTDEEMDTGAFYMRIMLFMGDIIFSEVTDMMAKVLSEKYYDKAQPTGQKVFRYHFILPNLFPGSPFSYVHGHHFVEMFYQFLTFLERYPKHRDEFYAKQSKQMVRMWLQFANGKDPWAEYKEEDGWKIAIADDIRGWGVYTKEQDYENSKEDPWGPRRYKQWELIREAFGQAESKGGLEGHESALRKMTNFKDHMKVEDRDGWKFYADEGV